MYLKRNDVMFPDYEKAASAAMELLISNQVIQTPIDSLSILLNQPRVRVMTFSEMASKTGTKRENLIPLFAGNQDAVTFHLDLPIDGVDYVVIYNRFLTMDVVFRGIARELGHIVLGHDGQTRTTEVRMAEALCFAHHLLSPRPVIRMLQKSNIPITLDVLADTTGCSSACVEGLQKIPGAHVPKELKIAVRNLFEQKINEYIRFHKESNITDHSPVIDFGSFMDNYEE